MSASRRTSLSTCSVWATPSAAVGSSRMTSLEFHSTARAIATVWRWPPDRLATCWRTDCDGAHREAGERLGGPSAPSSSSSSTTAAAEFATEEEVVHDVEVVAEREVLVDDLDAEGVGLLRVVHGDRLALEAVLAGVEGVDAGDALDQGALAGAVVPDQRGHLAGVDVEVDVLEHVHRSEALVDAAQRQQRSTARVAPVVASSVCMVIVQASSVDSRLGTRPSGVGPVRTDRAPRRHWCVTEMPSSVQAAAYAPVQMSDAFQKPSSMTSLTLSLKIACGICERGRDVLAELGVLDGRRWRCCWRPRP